MKAQPIPEIEKGIVHLQDAIDLDDRHRVSEDLREAELIAPGVKAFFDTGPAQGQSSACRVDAELPALHRCNDVAIGYSMVEIGNSTRGCSRKFLVDLSSQSSDATRLVVQFDPPVITRPSRLRPSGGVGLKFGTLPQSIGGMRYSRQAPAVVVLAFLCLELTGCGIPRSVGLAERCADIMRRANPGAALEITKSEASATSLTTIMAQVEAVRTDLPEGAPAPRDLAVECRFDENILTGFRWTAGPLH